MIAFGKAVVKSLLRRVSPRLGHSLQMRRRLRSTTVEPELRILGRLVGGGTAVDVGANEGLYCHVLAGLCDRVHAFEPNPDLCQLLVPALPANVTVHQVALSDREALATLRLPVDDSGLATIEAENPLAAAGRVRSLPIRTRTLDSFGLGDVRLIKIDVEGHEAAVVAGAAWTIVTHRPVLIIEIEERHKPGGLERVQALLAGPGYAGWYLLDGRLWPLATFAPERHQDPARRDRPYVHNFVFLPAETAPPPPLA